MAFPESNTELQQTEDNPLSHEQDYPSLINELTRLMPYNPQIKLSTNSCSFLFSTQDAASRCLRMMKPLLHLDENSSIGVTMQNGKSYYGFEIAKEQLDFLWKYYSNERSQYPLPEFYIKNIPGDKSNFFSAFLESVTHLPGERHKALRHRQTKKKRFTAKGTGIEDRQTRKPQYTKEEKEGFSKPQSLSYVNPSEGIAPKLFVRQNDYSNAQVAFMFSPQSVLINRVFIYDGGTVSDPYSSDDPAKVHAYFDKKTTGEAPVLFADINVMKSALRQRQNPNDLTEILGRARFTAQDSAIAISADSKASRWLSQGYATQVKQRLKIREAALGLSFSEDPKIPIYYYLPQNPSQHLKEYSLLSQAIDQAEATSLYENLQTRHAQFAKGEYEFLTCLDSVDQLLTEQYQNKPLLVHLIENGRAHIASLIYLRASETAQKAFAKVLMTEHFDLLEAFINQDEMTTKLLEQTDEIDVNKINTAGKAPIEIAMLWRKWDLALQFSTKTKEDYSERLAYQKGFMTAFKEGQSQLVHSMIHNTDILKNLKVSALPPEEMHELAFLQLLDNSRRYFLDLAKAFPENGELYTHAQQLSLCIQDAADYMMAKTPLEKNAAAVSFEAKMTLLFEGVRAHQYKLPTKTSHAILNVCAYILTCATGIGLVGLAFYAAVNKKMFSFVPDVNNQTQAQAIQRNSFFSHIKTETKKIRDDLQPPSPLRNGPGH